MQPNGIDVAPDNVLRYAFLLLSGSESEEKTKGKVPFGLRDAFKHVMLPGGLPFGVVLEEGKSDFPAHLATNLPVSYSCGESRRVPVEDSGVYKWLVPCLARDSFSTTYPPKIEVGSIASLMCLEDSPSSGFHFPKVSQYAGAPEVVQRSFPKLRILRLVTDMIEKKFPCPTDAVEFTVRRLELATSDLFDLPNTNENVRDSDMSYIL